MTEDHLLVFLFQVLLLLGLARGLGEVFRRFGQPPLVGEILVGIVLGPTILGRFFPELQAEIFPPEQIQQTMLETVSWFGVLLLLLETGLHVDASAAWRQRGPALRIGVIGVVVPLALGFGLSFALPDHYLADPDQRFAFALFLGTTMAISAMVIIARVLHDLDLIKTDLGLLTLCGYAVNDILAFVIFSQVFALATGAATSFVSSGLLFLATMFATGFSLTAGLKVVDRAIAYIDRTLPHQPGAVLTFVCCFGLALGGFTQWLGLTALFGFFLAGMLAGESHSLSENNREILSQMVHAIFVPIYFASIGLHIDFLDNFDLFLVVFVTVISIAGKYFGARIGALGTGLSRVDQESIGIAFTPSGVTGIVVAGVALELNIITQPIFVAIVFSAVISSLAVGPWLSWSIRRRKEVRVFDFFPSEGFTPRLQGGDRQEILADLCSQAARVPGAPQEEILLQAVRDREDLMGTGLGEGVAVPHARLENLEKPILWYGHSPGGVEWDAPDGLPVHDVFLLLTPKNKDDLQVQILAAIARSLSRKEVRKQLALANTTADARSVLEKELGSQSLVGSGDHS